MASSWHKFRRLPRLQRQLLMQAIMVLPLIYAALRFAGLRRVCAALSRLTLKNEVVSNLGAADSSRQAEATFRLVEVAASRVPWQLTCLPTSITTWCLLRRQGIPGRLRIGTRKAGDQLEAHAWIESSQLVLNGSPDGQHQYLAFAGSLLQTDERLR